MRTHTVIIIAEFLFGGHVRGSGVCYSYTYFGLTNKTSVAHKHTNKFGGHTRHMRAPYEPLACPQATLGIFECRYGIFGFRFQIFRPLLEILNMYFDRVSKYQTCISTGR